MFAFLEIGIISCFSALDCQFISTVIAELAKSPCPIRRYCSLNDCFPCYDRIFKDHQFLAAMYDRSQLAAVPEGLILNMSEMCFGQPLSF